jgi:hypothetical protein
LCWKTGRVAPGNGSPKDLLSRREQLFLKAFRADTLREIDAGMFMQIGIQLAPVTVVIMNSLAPRTNPQQTLKSFDMFECLRHA